MIRAAISRDVGFIHGAGYILHELIFVLARFWAVADRPPLRPSCV